MIKILENHFDNNIFEAEVSLPQNSAKAEREEVRKMENVFSANVATVSLDMKLQIIVKQMTEGI